MHNPNYNPKTIKAADVVNNKMSLYNKYKELDEFEIDEALLKSCELGRLDSVTYLLSNTQLKYIADVQSQLHLALLNSITRGHLNIASYLKDAIKGKDLEKYPRVYDTIEKSLFEACRTESLEFIRFFALGWKKKITQTSNIFYLKPSQLPQLGVFLK